MKKIGRYQIEGLLGQGGMGQVYRAYDPHFEREVALKLIAAHFLDNQQFRLRFEQEAKLIASLEHPAVVPLYDFGEANDQPFLVMRFMSGGSLAERLKANKGISLSDVLKLVTVLADALDIAHQKGIIHRNLKPANILFDKEGLPYLSDLGFVKLLEQTNVGLSQTGIPLGSLAYMSPEQARGDRRIIDGRSDVYSFGVMLFELLTGELPFMSNLPAGFIYKHISAPIPKICDIRRDLPQSCQALIERAMAKKPAERYQTVCEMATALKDVLAEGSSSKIYRLQRLLQLGDLSRLVGLLLVAGVFTLMALEVADLLDLPDLTQIPNKQSSVPLPTLIPSTLIPSQSVIITPTRINTSLPTHTNSPPIRQR